MNEKIEAYRDALRRIRSLIEGERDEIAVLATVTAELHHQFAHFNWVGFYRVVLPGVLKVGPYQGGHGCLTITFDRGVCGKCAREKSTQVIADVRQIPYHIACSGTTRSEMVVPLLDSHGAVRAVLDIDSDTPNAFDAVDQSQLELLARDVAAVYG
jgi:L-methionine (R)-S-oxide reductase